MTFAATGMVALSLECLGVALVFFGIAGLLLNHIATQRASRWDIPAAFARLARTVRLKRLWRRDGMAFEGDAVQRAADEIEFALRKDDDNAEGASSSHDHPIRMQ
jgi:hypothetical protein